MLFEAQGNMLGAVGGGGGGIGDPLGLEPLLELHELGDQGFRGLRGVGGRVPEPLGQGRRAGEDFLEERVLVGEFGPEAQLAAQHMTVLQGFVELVVHVVPVGEGAPGVLAQDIAVPAIQVEEVVVGENDLLTGVAAGL